MPNYDYECDACGATFELFQSMKDDPLKTCPKCQRPMLRRLIGTGLGIMFKGGGFYETDYKRVASPAGKNEAAGESNATGTSKEAPKKADAGSSAPASNPASPAP